MKDTRTLLLLICFALFSLANGYHVRRSDILGLQPIADINDDIQISEVPQEEPFENIHEEPLDSIHEEPLDNIHEEPLENPDEDHQVNILDAFNEDQNEQDIEEEENNEELPSEIDLTVTDPNVPDVGVDGEEEKPIDQENTNSEEENTDPIEEENTDPIEEENTDSIEEENTLVDMCDGSTKNYLPSTRNCSLFYDCTNDKDIISCPHGMWFDPNYIGDTLCQYPEVICAADNDICDCAEKYPPPPPDPLMESSVECLKDNRFHLSASQVSCGRYFVCHNEMKYRMECRQGLHYNSKTEMCDYPEVVNCRIPDPDCPAEGIKFLPDSTRCEVFYFCVHGYKTKQVCPFYHIWDIRSNSCRRQDEAICHLEQ